MKKFLMMVVLGLTGLGFQAAMAHGEHPARHGGIVQTVQELDFELVVQPDGALLYVEDHGKALALAGASGKLTVLQGSQKADYALAVAGERFEARGALLSSGARVVAVLTLPGRKTLTVRFSVK